VRVSAWRIVKRKHLETAFTGDGARLYGGRWHSKGQAVVYTAASCSLAALEMLVHLQNQEILEAYQTIKVSFDRRFMQILGPDILPSNWRANPAPRKLKLMGDEWLASGSSPVLQVPSVVVETEHNYLLNPGHPHFVKITLGLPTPFSFDPRLAR
jgi:RES domain-containing protein